MPKAPVNYSTYPETALVRLAKSGDRDAFAEVVNRRQVWIRNLMRRCSGNVTLADDLAQQVFMQAWRSIRQLQNPSRFGPWLKRTAINTWLQHQRRNDPLRHADEHKEPHSTSSDTTSLAMDLDRALSTLTDDVRVCIVLGYHNRMTHQEIAQMTELPLGTVKSHIRRGTQKLQQELAAYSEPAEVSA